MLPDGYLASTSHEIIKIWDTNTGNVMRTLEGHKYDVMCLVVLKNGYLASGDEDDDGKIKIWDTTTGNEIQTLEGHTDWVTCLVVLPNGFLASGSCDDTIKIWDTNNGKETRTLEGHKYTFCSLAVLPNGYLASGSSEDIKIWDTNTGDEIRTLTYLASDSPKEISEEYPRDVFCLAVLPDGRLASGYYDDRIKIWDTKTGKELMPLTGHEGAVWSLVILPNGQLASASMDAEM